MQDIYVETVKGISDGTAYIVVLEVENLKYN